jgi:hypothetical protein
MVIKLGSLKNQLTSKYDAQKMPSGVNDLAEDGEVA